MQSANIKLLTALERNSETLDRVSTDFYETLAKSDALQIWSFAEEKEIRWGPIGMHIVPADSAKMGHHRENWGTISGDHRDIAKYITFRDDGYIKVSSVLAKWVREIARNSNG
jgi:hypothetical protein